VSSFKVIEVHESSDSEIENFLEEEDPTYHKLNTSQAYNFVGNLSPCLKHNKYFPRIKLSQNPTVDSGSVLMHNHMSPQSTVLDPWCEVFLFWIDKYYTNIPSLQGNIRTLTTHIDSLTSENHRLEISVQRQGKRLKKTRNIIIIYLECVEAVINYEVLWFKFSIQLKGKDFFLS